MPKDSAANGTCVLPRGLVFLFTKPYVIGGMPNRKSAHRCTCAKHIAGISQHKYAAISGYLDKQEQ